MSDDERPRDTDAVASVPSHSPDSPQVPSGVADEPAEYDPETSAHHDHVALLYADRDEQFEGVVPFVRDGLERGDRCIYIADDNPVSAVVDALTEAGVDVDDAVDSGALTFYSKGETFLRGDRFDSEEMREFAIETIRETSEAGYDALCITGEMTWVLEDGRDIDPMIEYERMLNGVFGERDVTGICQYNVERFDAEILNQVVRSHPNVVYGGTAARDFYYLPTESEAAADATGEGTDSAETLLERVRAYETLERRERSLQALNEATQELMYLDRDDIVGRTADIVRDVLDVAYASFWVYDEDSGELERHASSAPEDADVSSLADRDGDRAWDVFVSEEATVYSDVQGTDGDGVDGAGAEADGDTRSGVETTAAGESGTDANGPRLENGIIVPLGRHGVFCAASTRPHRFEDTTVSLAKTVGANVEAALDRADRERTLEEKNDRLEHLERLNRVIRDIDEALVDADTRADVERLVCERLAAAGPYEFVWVGEEDLETNVVGPRARAGDERGYLEEITITTGDTPTGTGPAGTALETGEAQVVQDVLTDPTFAPWREAGLSRGFRSCICVPLVYEELVYGVLTLYKGRPNAFDDLERAVLSELGGTIAHAIDAAETRQALQTDSVTELTLEVRGADDVLDILARAADCRVEFGGLVPQYGDDESARLFFSTRGVAPEDVREAAEAVSGLVDVTSIGTDDESAVATFEATVAESTVAAHAVERQAIVRSLTVEDGVSTVVVDLPSTGDVRAFVEEFRAVYPETELLKRQSLDRPVTTRADLRDAIGDRLTDRQRETLETAYRSGFFESPRARTGEELSDAMGISQSTLTHHLREAERRLCELVFENV